MDQNIQQQLHELTKTVQSLYSLITVWFVLSILAALLFWFAS